MPEAIWLGGVAFATSAAVSYLIVRSARWHLSFTADQPGNLPQKFHNAPVPRIGGVAVLAGMAVTGLNAWLLPADAMLYWMLMLSLIPAFVGGLLEDVTHRVGPGARLLLTVITAALAFILAGVHFERSHMQWLDRALAFAPFGYVALLFAVAGVAHAMNIIDGYHGLCAGVALCILLALGAVAHQHGDALVASFCLGAAAATLGFVLLNYPRGWLFLGDGGAYLIGCTIALAAALLVLRNGDVSPWFPLALVIYPVWETIFSLVRRLWGSRHIGEPDALHLHSLVYARISRRFFAGPRAADKAWGNAVTALPFWSAELLVALVAVAWHQDTRVQQALAALFVLAYCLGYWKIARLPMPAPATTSSGAPALASDSRAD